MTDVLCLDANVYVKVLVLEAPPELTTAGERLLRRVEIGRAVLVLPAFGWAEVASTLRKKVRTREITDAQAERHWNRFLTYPIKYSDTPRIRARAWEIADQYNLPTLYDAAYLACTELADVEDPGEREFWTANDRLLAHLGAPLPSYVHQLQ